MNCTEILDAARQAITVDRAATHGEAENTFPDIAGLWSVLFGIDITAAQVAQAMVLFKVARMKANPGHADNYTDAVGYAAIAGELADPVPTEWTDAMVEAMVEAPTNRAGEAVGGQLQREVESAQQVLPCGCDWRVYCPKCAASRGYAVNPEARRPSYGPSYGEADV